MDIHGPDQGLGHGWDESLMRLQIVKDSVAPPEAMLFNGHEVGAGLKGGLGGTPAKGMQWEGCRGEPQCPKNTA